VETVRTWLLASGIDPKHIVQSDNKGWIAMNIPAWKAEELFQTMYHEHEHAKSGAVRIGTDEYYLPDHVREHIDYITPGIKLSAALKKTELKRSSPTLSSRANHVQGPKKAPGDASPWSLPAGASLLPPDLQQCGRNMTPTCFKALYEIPEAPKNPSSVDIMGLYESGDIYSQEDIDSFFAEYAPYVPQGTHPKLDSIDGGEAPVSPDSQYNTGESDIDMDISFSIIYVSSGNTT
jgi:tripeptidyl-peptidase-1